MTPQTTMLTNKQKNVGPESNRAYCNGSRRRCSHKKKKGKPHRRKKKTPACPGVRVVAKGGGRCDSRCGTAACRWTN